MAKPENEQSHDNYPGQEHRFSESILLQQTILEDRLVPKAPSPATATSKGSLHPYNMRPCTLCEQTEYVRAPFTKQVFADGEAAVFICKNCGMTPFFSTYDTTNEMKVKQQYYEEGIYHAERDNGTQYISLIREDLHIINELRNLKGARVLDIGCGEGLALLEMKNLGAIPKGVEPADSEAAKLRAQGFDVKTCIFEEYKADKNEVFDAVTLFWVLDSIKDPVSALKKVRSLMANDGILYIRIGSRYGTPFVKWTKGEWRIIQKAIKFAQPSKITSFYHPYYFTHKTLIAMLEYAGFKVVRMTPSQERITKIWAIPAESKPFSKLKTEEWAKLWMYFAQWRLHDAVTRPLLQNYPRQLNKFTRTLDKGLHFGHRLKTALTNRSRRHGA